MCYTCYKLYNDDYLIKNMDYLLKNINSFYEIVNSSLTIIMRIYILLKTHCEIHENVTHTFSKRIYKYTNENPCCTCSTTLPLFENVEFKIVQNKTIMNENVGC